MIIDDADNADYFLFKFNVSNAEKKRILFLKKFYDEKIDKNSFLEKNLWKVLYYNGKQSLRDLLYFEIFKSKNINKKLINLIDLFKNKEVPTFPIKAKNLIEKYNIPEGKLLGIKLKKIEEKWISKPHHTVQTSDSPASGGKDANRPSSIALNFKFLTPENQKR